MELLLDAALLLMLLSLSAFFSASEVAFLSISNVRLHSLLEKKATGAESLGRLRANKWRVIIAFIIWTNVVSMSAASFTTLVAIFMFGDQGLGMAIGIMTFLLITFGEIIPKSFATGNGEWFILLFAPLIEFLFVLISPLVFVFELINRLIPGVYSRATKVERFTEEEVLSAVKLGVKHQSISEREQKLIENVLEFNDRAVGAAMTPRSRVVALDGNMLVSVAHKKALEHSMYSRFPVMQNGKVIGTVSVKVLGRALYQHPDWHLHRIVWQPVKINVNDKASDAFSRLQRLGRNIAVVVNEKDEFMGVITLEDLLEELVGEINRHPIASRTY